MDTLSQLTGAARVYLDTNCFIYFLEKHPILFPVILPVFEAAMNGDYQIVTSKLTLAELLIRPYQLGRSDIAITYREFLADIEIVTLTPISLNILDKAAAIRAAHKTALPDAIHIATAVEAHCDVFMSNDRKMKGVNGLGLRYVYLS
jgi:predicted nucleic acid-binding protein